MDNDEISIDLIKAAIDNASRISFLAGMAAMGQVGSSLASMGQGVDAITSYMGDMIERWITFQDDQREISILTASFRRSFKEVERFIEHEMERLPTDFPRSWNG